MPSVKSQPTALSTAGLGNLFVVYVIWSSTYLAVRIMVHSGSGMSVWAGGSYRMVLAGLILLGFGVIRHHRIRVSRKELGYLFITGVLMWFCSHGLVMWVERQANSGFVALAIGSAPIWAALIDALLDHRMPSRNLVGALLLSFAGITCLIAPSLTQGRTTELGAGILIILSAALWALASVLQDRWQVKLEAPVIAGYQHLMAGIGYVAVALLSGQILTHAVPSAWMAMAYLIVFGSVIGFTSFISALQRLPINIAMTYAFVNPVLAQILGWWLLDEPLTIWTLIGTVLVILGVVRVFADRNRRARKINETETHQVA